MFRIIISIVIGLIGGFYANSEMNKNKKKKWEKDRDNIPQMTVSPCSQPVKELPPHFDKYIIKQSFLDANATLYKVDVTANKLKAVGKIKRGVVVPVYKVIPLQQKGAESPENYLQIVPNETLLIKEKDAEKL